MLVQCTILRQWMPVSGPDQHVLGGLRENCEIVGGSLNLFLGVRQLIERGRKAEDSNVAWGALTILARLMSAESPRCLRQGTCYMPTREPRHSGRSIHRELAIVKHLVLRFLDLIGSLACSEP